MKRTVKNFKFYTLMVMLYITILVSAVLLDYKFISIGHMLASSATFIISLTFFIGDIIAEVYGYRCARQVVYSGVVCLIIFAFIIYLLGNLDIPLNYTDYGNAFKLVAQLLLRACLANAAAIMVGAYLNVYLLSKWKVLVKGRYFWLRSLGSSAIGESLYTVFVVSLVNAGIVGFRHFIDILIISYCFKLLFDLFAVVPASMLARFLKKVEGM